MVGGVPGSGLRNQGIRVFSLDRDTLDFLKQIPYLYADVNLYDDLNCQPYNEGWSAIGQTTDSVKQNIRYFFNTSPRSGEPKAIVASSNGILSCIGDVNGDNIPDYAIAFASRLIIYSGEDVSSTTVENQTIVQNIFPNPTTNQVVVCSPHVTQQNMQLSCVSLSGKNNTPISQYYSNQDSSCVTIATDNLLNGVYLLTVRSIIGSDTFKLIINR
jgi:hypothetical protein